MDTPSLDRRDVREASLVGTAAVALLLQAAGTTPRTTTPARTTRAPTTPRSGR
jgi:hypothetical protein